MNEEVFDIGRNLAPLTKPYERLTERQKLFIEYFIQTQNASESAKRAGYTEKACGELGYALKKQLAPYIAERLDTAKTDKAIMDTNEILATLSRIARGEEKDAFGLDTSNQDKLKALELLGKANQLYVDKVKQETNLDINVNLTDDEEDVEYLPADADTVGETEYLDSEGHKLLEAGDE